MARAVGKVSSIVSRWGRLSQVLETSHLLFVDDTLLSFVRLLKAIYYTGYVSYCAMKQYPNSKFGTRVS